MTVLLISVITVNILKSYNHGAISFKNPKIKFCFEKIFQSTTILKNIFEKFFEKYLMKVLRIE